MSKLILFQGDSITDCNRKREEWGNLGAGYAGMTAGELAAKYPYEYEFLNRGISGNRIVDLHARVRRDMINLKPDYMSILIGVNDAWHEFTQQNGVDAEKFEKLYDMLIEELRHDLPDTKLMILEPFVLPGCKTDNVDEHPHRWDFFRDEVALRAQAAKRIAQKYDLPFILLQDTFNAANADAPADGYWLVDGVHPSAAGHALIKKAWIDMFERIR